MKTVRSRRSSRNRLAGSKWLSFALAVILALSIAVLAWITDVVPERNVVASAAPPKPAGITFVVNRTGDAAGVGQASRCDTEPLTPGDQCTLRAAIRATNAVPGDEETIIFNIPSSDGGCSPFNGGTCTINLTQARSEERRVGKECRSRWSPYH